MAIVNVPNSTNATTIQGRTVSGTAPVEGQALVWDAASSSWLPQSADIVQSQSGAAASHTGDTNETLLKTVAIPANMLGANGLIMVFLLMARAGATALVTYNVRFGASGAGLGATLLSNASLATTTLVVLGQTMIVNTNATNAQTANRNPVGVSANAALTAAIDTTAATEVDISCVLTNATDTATLLGYTVTVQPHA